MIAASMLLGPLPAAAQQSKTALAVQLAQLHARIEGAGITEQLTATAVQPLVSKWSRQLQQSVPEPLQDSVRDQLDAELQKFTDQTRAAVNASLQEAARSTLTPIYEKEFGEDELQTLIDYLESPAVARYRELGPQTANVWAQAVVDATREGVEAGLHDFDQAAERIVARAAQTPQDDQP